MIAQKRLKGLWELLASNIETKVGGTIVAVFLITVLAEAIGGFAILPYNPLRPLVGRPLQPPSLAHPFGTSNLGHDVFSQVIAGAPNDAMVSFFVVATALAIGAPLGAYAGVVGGVVDEILMRITDIFFAVPAIVLGIAITVILGPNPVNVMIALATIWWPAYARLSRSEALRLATTHYVEAARLGGLGNARIVRRHILPVITPQMLVYATLDVGTVVLAYSGLAYLGLAVRPPYPDWGDMVARSQEYILTAPWLPLIPALVILVIAIGFSLLGDGLRSALHKQRGS